LAWAGLLDAGLRAGVASAPRVSPWPRMARVTAGVWVLSQALLFAGVAWQMRAQQTIIENNHRREIGRWLRSHAAPGDRVYLEPLGYIGFYSGLKMLDYPGLASPEVVAARRSGHRSYAQIIAALRPEWLVLRPDQVAGIQRETPRLLGEDYHLARVFDARGEVDAMTFLPGRGYLEFDALFLVFNRTPVSMPKS
jgi:hypothetical protein